MGKYGKVMNLLPLLFIYKVQAIELGAYVGCFLDTIPSSVYYALPEDMTNEKCASFCCFISTNMTFSGTVISRECICSNERDVLTFKIYNDDACNFRCTGNSSQICGGFLIPNYYFVSLFRLDCPGSTFYQSTYISSWSNTIQTTGSTRLSTSSTTTDNADDTIVLTSSYTTDSIVSQQQLDVQLDKLRKENLIDKTTTKLYLSKKRCATDNRKSARNMGILGIVVLILPLCLIVGNDLMRVFRGPE